MQLFGSNLRDGCIFLFSGNFVVQIDGFGDGKKCVFNVNSTVLSYVKLYAIMIAVCGSE